MAGLSTAGPVAGGWFAANMGAGVAAGSWMSLLQTAAMTTPWAPVILAAGAGGGIGYWLTKDACKPIDGF